MIGKLKRVEANQRATLLRITKMAIGEGGRIRKRKHPNQSKKGKKKRKCSSSSSSATNTKSDNASSDNESMIKRFKVVPEDKRYKYKISKSMASFGNENFELYLPDKELHFNIFKKSIA